MSKVTSFAPFRKKDAVEEDLQNIKGCRIGANVSRPFNVLDRYSDASYAGV